MTNPLVELQALGQSIWLDNIRRGMLRSGELKALIDAGEISGLTSNPTIFEKAIAGSQDYGQALPDLLQADLSNQEVFEALAIEDIQVTADLLLPVYERSGKSDGFVSIEVSPLLARDTRSTIAEAHRLWEQVNRPNLMVKIPATAEGIPAIEQCLHDGLNINITLIFSRDRYAEVMEAYLRALERRVAEGKRVEEVASVASFFVSRVDSKVDGRLEAIIRQEGPDADKAAWLLGKAAIANAKLAYQDFRTNFDSPRFRELRAYGAQLQRPLWASTSTKNPAYPDVYYVEGLIGPDTVNTLPPQTVDAYRDHGRPAVRIDRGLEEARNQLMELETLGIPMAEVTKELEDEGVAAFSKSFESLLAAIEVRRRERMPKQASPSSAPQSIGGAVMDRPPVDAGRTALQNLEEAVRRRLEHLEATRFLQRLWDKDPTLWTDDESQHPEIRERLGWLDVHDMLLGKVDELTAFADEVRSAGFTHAALLGMGGSSLCPEVLRETFGVREGYLDLAVLDSTDPDSVRAIERRADVAKTLFIVASKSGSTIEPNMFLAYFWDRVKDKQGDRVGGNFVAITDPGTAMDRLAQERGFRRIFRNPPDIGGRYSALSYFGLVPAALIGLDLRELLSRAQRMAEASKPGQTVGDSPGVWLGAAIGEAALAGRDKLTLLASPAVRTFGYWVEQLIAESTGKQGKGIVPVESEPIGRPTGYGGDRLFVYLRLGDELDRPVQALIRAGHPVVTLPLADPYDLAAEFYRWEIANVVAGAMLGVNVFDQPNVQESKDNTGRLLQRFRQKGELPPGKRAWAKAGLEIYGKSLPAELKTSRTLARAIAAQLRRVKPGDYVAINAFLQRTPRAEAALRSMRKSIQDHLGVATTAGYGPRFLHSTGQLHKGGSNRVVVLQITADPERDLHIPGEAFTFGVLERAQALGDFEALASKKRRAIHVHLASARQLKELASALAEAAKSLGRPRRKSAGRRATDGPKRPGPSRSRAKRAVKKRATAASRAS